MSADERREIVLRVAEEEFARRGYVGTSTEAIAKRVGVSQPYLFRLFPSKRALFCAVTVRCYDRVYDEFADAIAGLTGEEALRAIGARYRELLTSTSNLAMQLQVYAAGLDDPELRELGRAKWAGLWRLISGIPGVTPDMVLRGLSIGMFVNVLTALEVPYEPGEKLAGSLDAWARDQ